MRHYFITYNNNEDDCLYGLKELRGKTLGVLDTMGYTYQLHPTEGVIK